MATMTTREKIKARRLDAMRLGQASMDFVVLPSDPEIRFGLVPLTEAEYDMALGYAGRIDAEENVAGGIRRQREMNRWCLVFSLREADNIEQRAFESVEQMMDTLATTDVDILIDEFQEMTDNRNPAIDGISPEEFDTLKKVLPTLPWNELSGRSWYAAKRFLGALIRDGVLRGNFPGSTSTPHSTTTSE